MITSETNDILLPPYLREDRKPGFLQELKAFASQKNYYALLSDPEPLQGDCWSGITVIEAGSSPVTLKCLVISNSCDLAKANFRFSNPNVSLVPLVLIDRYETGLKAEFDANRVTDHIADIRAQRVSSMFFLPSHPGVGGDCIACLDQIYTVPLQTFTERAVTKRVFSLRDTAFYLLLFKLSFHFCRLHENIDRSPTA